MLTDWHPLGAVLYRKWAVYDDIKLFGNNSSEKTLSSKSSVINNKKLNFDDYLICGSSFGGPIAFISDIRTCPNIGNSNNGHILIFTSSGVKLAEVSLSVEWGEHSEQVIVGMGWTDQEHLVICLQNGLII